MPTQPYKPPVPIPYPSVGDDPFTVPLFIAGPLDVRVMTQLNSQADTDPMAVIQGSDALPLTVLGLFLKYAVEGAP